MEHPESSTTVTTEQTQEKAQPAAQSALREDWAEVTEQHPAPSYGLESPVISHLLSTWTTDTAKVQYAVCLSTPHDPTCIV